MTSNLRIYGNKPYRTAVIHGGPGVAGSMAPVARELCCITGVLEPLQMADSLEGQVDELYTSLEGNSDQPLVLVGWSWGALLGLIIAARFPLSVKKLILVGCPPLEDKYAIDIMSTRLSRLNEKNRERVLYLTTLMSQSVSGDNNNVFASFGEIIDKADSYSPLPNTKSGFIYNHDIYRKVWPQAAELRNSGSLLKMTENINCPVVAIHGDYDPHPAAGVREPLSRSLKDFRIIVLKNCGHTPWLEKYARGIFFEMISSEITGTFTLL